MLFTIGKSLILTTTHTFHNMINMHIN